MTFVTASAADAWAFTTMEAQVCLKKSSFPEALRDIEQRHLSSSGNDIFAISSNSVPLEALCENAPTISSALSGF